MIFQAEVLITPREGVLDTQGKAVEKTLTHLGYKGVSEVRVGKIVRMQLKNQNQPCFSAYFIRPTTFFEPVFANSDFR